MFNKTTVDGDVDSRHSGRLGDVRIGSEQKLVSRELKIH